MFHALSVCVCRALHMCVCVSHVICVCMCVWISHYLSSLCVCFVCMCVHVTYVWVYMCVTHTVHTHSIRVVWVYLICHSERVSMIVKTSREGIAPQIMPWPSAFSVHHVYCTPHDAPEPTTTTPDLHLWCVSWGWVYGVYIRCECMRVVWGCIYDSENLSGGGSTPNYALTLCL